MTLIEENPVSIYQDKNFYIIISVTLIAVLGGTIITPVLPTLTKEFNVSPEKIGLVMTVLLIPVAIGTPIFSIMADRFGRKQILVPSLILFAGAGAFCAFASNFSMLLFWRFLQGVGASSLESLQLTIIGDLYSGKMLMVAMAFNASMIGISSTIYPLIGGALASINWRYPFLFSVIALPVAFLVLMVLKLPTKQKPREDFNLTSYIQNTLGSVNNRSVIGLLVVISSLFIVQFGACYSYIPILAEEKFAASEAIIGIILASMSISLAFVASQLGLFAQKFSEIRLIKISFIITIIGLAIVPFLNGSVWLLLIPIMLLGAAFGLAFPTTQALLAGLAPGEYRAGFMAVNATVQALGQALGPSISGLAFAYGGSTGVFEVNALLAIAILGLFNYLSKGSKKPTTPREPVEKPIVAVAENINTNISFTTTQPTGFIPYESSPTIIQENRARFIHLDSSREINLPKDLLVIRIGKANEKFPPDIDMSEFPDCQTVSRVHAAIRIEGANYYIEDLGSSNGTYLNNLPLLPKNLYKIRDGDYITLGRGTNFKFQFNIS
jgi:MFS family permease